MPKSSDGELRLRRRSFAGRLWKAPSYFRDSYCRLRSYGCDRREALAGAWGWTWLLIRM